jgi:hypothetical protein
MGSLATKVGVVGHRIAPDYESGPDHTKAASPQPSRRTRPQVTGVFFSSLGLVRLHGMKPHHGFNSVMDWVNPYLTLNPMVGLNPSTNPCVSQSYLFF